ncbi:Hypothetical protein A7982_01951 [Minicystis rosea]|nr:Hypothetical protein A7982_01951 [Minicystis rosea]
MGDAAQAICLHPCRRLRGPGERGQGGKCDGKSDVLRDHDVRLRTRRAPAHRQTSQKCEHPGAVDRIAGRPRAMGMPPRRRLCFPRSARSAKAMGRRDGG